MDYARAIDQATVRTFRVPGVGMVRVEIGDEVTRETVTGRHEHGHTYPAYRVSIDGAEVMAGADWGVPVSMCTDDVNAMIALVSAVAYDLDHQDLEWWASARRELRDALTAPGAGDPFEIGRAALRGELG